jgi:Spy/CpxP family protein refolding chaperone
MTYKPFQKMATAALLVAGTLAAGTALAQPGPGPGRDRFARGIRAAMAMLDLTDAQKTKVKAIFESRRSEGMAFRAQVQADRAALRAAAMAVNPDAAAVGTAFLKVQADRQAAATKGKAVRAQIDAVLTPEQKAKLDGWTAAHRQMRGMGRRGGPPQD